MKRTPLKRKTPLKAKAPIKGAAKPIRATKKRRPGQGVREATLDRIFSLYIRRDGVCQYAGRDGVQCSPQLQAMHIKSRRYRCIRWNEYNLTCGCAAHHRYYHNNPDLFIKAIEMLWPGRLDIVQKLYLEQTKPDKQAIKDWLNGMGFK